ncbi:hypothetical protein BJ138DRAFT_1149068, partial [Hygrophoropsis aurantiaca]
MSDVSAAMDWGPGLIGLALSLGMYGVALAQYGFYLNAFPRDPRGLKALVLFVFIIDALHSYGMIAYNWAILVTCHRGVIGECPADLPWEAVMAPVISYSTTFIVQSFYGHRLWIISAHNKYITFTVFVIAVIEYALGISCIVGIIRNAGSPTAANTALAVGGAAAGLSVTCDVLITSSVFFYLRPQRSGIKRTGTAMQQLINIFVNMGLLTCLISLSLFVFNWTEDGQYWIGAPAPLICKSYTNSLMAVLNARKFIRDHAAKTAVELQTLPATRTSADQAPSVEL